MNLKHYYRFKKLPNYWVDDNDRKYDDEFFNDKDYEDLYFDNFYDMDEIFGSENSLFGTRGLPVGHPDRSSKSFDQYNSKFGPMIVRVVKNNMNLQETIRKVLREENVGFKKRIKNTIEELGIYETAKMIGISITKLVEISDHPIDSELSHEILIENLINKKLPREYRNFKIYPTMDGIVYWEMKRDSKHFLPGMSEHISAVATPFWDGNPWTPVDIDWFTLFNENGDIIAEKELSGDYYVQLKHKTSFDTVDELFKWYVGYYLPVVYSTVMRDLLPEVYQEIDDKLDNKGGY